jgi:hypothetical protein
MNKIGIIGGSGLDDPSLFEDLFFLCYDLDSGELYEEYNN